MGSMRIKSQAFENNGKIPSNYTCDGKNISPPLQWEEAPKATQSFVLIVDDPDAPNKTWVHWVVYNIPDNITEAKEGRSPQGALQGINDFKQASYGGPCPPSGTHRYFFKLYALDTKLSIPSYSYPSDLEKAMQGHVLEQAELMGLYSRKN